MNLADSHKNDIYRFLGLIQKAGKLASGDETVFNTITAFEAQLVIIAEDASELTRKKFSDKTSFYEVEKVFFGEKELLGRAIGKKARAVLAGKEEGFAEARKKKLELL